MSIAEIVARSPLSGEAVRHHIERVDNRIVGRITGERLAILLGLGREFPGEREEDERHDKLGDFRLKIREDAKANGVVVVNWMTQWLEEKENPSLDNLGLSARAQNALDACSAKTLADIVKLCHHEILMHRGVGEVTVTEIKAMLAERGLSLKPDPTFYARQYKK